MRVDNPDVRDNERLTTIYRTYLLRDGRIANGENIDAISLAEAIIVSEKILADQPAQEGYEGIEIWQARSLVYATTAYRDRHECLSYPTTAAVANRPSPTPLLPQVAAHSI